MSFPRSYLAAVRAFTRVPVSGTLGQWVGSSLETPGAIGAHFPGVGWLVGIVACAAFALVGLVLPGNPFAPLAAAVGCTLATLILTGAMHESSLARTADVLGAPAGRALEAAKDPRIGSFGVLALILALLGKASLLAVLAAQSPVAVLMALLAGHVLSRFWPLLLARGVPGLPGLAYLPVPGEAGAASPPLADRLESRGFGIAAAWSVAALALAWITQGAGFVILALLASGFAFLWVRRLFARRLQGFTGDGLGAMQQVCETAFYLGAAVGLNVG